MSSTMKCHQKIDVILPYLCARFTLRFLPVAYIGDGCRNSRFLPTRGALALHTGAPNSPATQQFQFKLPRRAKREYQRRSLIFFRAESDNVPWGLLIHGPSQKFSAAQGGFRLKFDLRSAY